MKVLLGGGSGFIGQHLETALLKRGHRVQIISRNSGKERVTWSELEREQTLPECDAVVNLSGEYILNFFRRWNNSYQNDIYESRIGMNKILVNLMTKGTRKPSVWVSAHAEGYYPRSIVKAYDEYYVERNPSNYGQKLCVDWESSALLPAHEKIRHVGIRLGVVLGRSGGLIKQSWWPFWCGLGGVVGSGTQKFPWIHINDCVNLFIHAIENENTNGYYNAVSPGICNITEFTKAFGKAIYRPTIFTIPEFVVRLGVGSDRAPFLLEGCDIKPKRTIESGFKFEFEDINSAMENIAS